MPWTVARMASSHFGSSTKRSSRVSKSFQLVKPKLYSSTSMFGGRGHQSHKRRAGSYPGGFSLLLSPFGRTVLNRTRLSYSHKATRGSLCASAPPATALPFPDRGLSAASRQESRDGRYERRLAQ